MHFKKIDSNYTEYNIPEQIEETKPQSDSNAEISIDFADNNNIVEPSDILYSSDEAKSLAKPYLKFLDKYTDGNHSWTQALTDIVKNIIRVFNQGNKQPDENELKPKSEILLSKDNKIISTYLQTTLGEEETVIYEYRPDGSLKQTDYTGEKVIDYRKDGTRFSLHTTDIDAPELNIKYDDNGKIAHKTESDLGKFNEVKYEDGKVIEVYNKNMHSAQRTIYNDGKAVLITKYDKHGKVENYTDKYFGNKLYNENPPDGKIDLPVRQGTAGTCYIAGMVNSLTFIPKGRQLLDDILPKSNSDEFFRVLLPGLKRNYSFAKSDIINNMSRLGRRDADYPLLVKAIEEFRLEPKTEEELENLPSYFYHYDKNYGRVVDSGYPTEVFYALTGKEMSMSGKKITDKDIQKARKCLETGNGVVNAGTICKETSDFEIPIEDKKLGITPKHNLAVKKISDKYVTLYDSVTENIINYPIDKFKKYFSQIFYATLD